MCSRRTSFRDDRVRLRLEAVAVVVAEDVAVEFVAAGLRDDVHDAACRAAVLGFVPSGLHVDGLDELEVQLLALKAVLGPRRVHAVDVEGVLGAAGPVNRDRGLVRVEGIRVGGDARDDLRDRGVVAAARERGDRAVVEVRADGRRPEGDGGRLARHRHLHFRGNVKVHVERRVFPEPDRHAVLRLAGETLQRERQDVRAGREEREPVTSLAVRDRRRGSLERGTGRLDGSTREGECPVRRSRARRCCSSSGRKRPGRRGRRERAPRERDVRASGSS